MPAALLILPLWALIAIAVFFAALIVVAFGIKDAGAKEDR